MTFEKWCELIDIDALDKIAFADPPMDYLVLRDWKAEREKLIGALGQLLVFEDDHDAAGTEWHDAQKLAVEQARAVLVGKEKE